MDADRALVEAVLENRPGAFERLVRDYQGLCWHVIQRMVRHPEDTRELCQEAFLRVHFSKVGEQTQMALETWIVEGEARKLPVARLTELAAELRRTRGQPGKA